MTGVSPSWLETTVVLNDFQRAQHDAALRVLDAYRLSGTPFLLYLRTFRIIQAYDGILMEAHLQSELAPLGANVLRVQQVGGEPDDVVHIGGNFEVLGKYRATRGEVDALFSGEIPGLAMRHETWRDAIKELIASAELIVSELQFLTPGVGDELRACIDAGKADQTVLILPVGPFPSAGHTDELAEFPRGIHQADVKSTSPWRYLRVPRSHCSHWPHCHAG